MSRWRSGIKPPYLLLLVCALCIQGWLFRVVFKGNATGRPASENIVKYNTQVEENMKGNQVQRTRLDPEPSATGHVRSIREYQVDPGLERILIDKPTEKDIKGTVLANFRRLATDSRHVPRIVLDERKLVTTAVDRPEKHVPREDTDFVRSRQSDEVAHKHGRSMKSTKDETPIQDGDLIQNGVHEQNLVSNQNGVLTEDGVPKPADSPKQDGASKENGVPKQNGASTTENDVLKPTDSPKQGGAYQENDVLKPADSPKQDGVPENMTSLPLGNATLCRSILASDAKPAETYNWYKIAEREIYAFSAYLDERESVKGPLVRVLATGLQLKFHDIGSLYCTLMFRGLKHPVSVQATYEYIYPSNLWADEYTAHWILCPVPREILQQRGEPVSISMLPSACEPLPHFLLPVHVRQPRTGRRKIALCLPVLYGGRDWAQTAEWIILHKLLGYSTVFLYVKSSSVTTNKVLRLYGPNYDPDIKVKAMPWTLPKIKQFYMGQHAAINECLYRAGLEHDYVTVCDKDEILMPMKYPSILDFLAKFETQDTAAYLFQHVMFNLDKTEPLTSSKITNITGVDIQKHNINIADLQLASLVYKWHMEEPHPALKVRSKTIYNVNRTISADIHSPRHLVSGFTELMVAPSDGAVYHYRTKPPAIWLNAVNFEYGTKVDRYRTRLLTEMIHLLGKLDKR